MSGAISIDARQAEMLSELIREAETKAKLILGMNVSMRITSPIMGVANEDDFVSKIMSIVCNGLNVNEADITGKVRYKNIVEARFMFWVLARDIAKISFTRLGEITGGRDHTTVLAGIRAMRNHIETEEETKQVYNYLKRLVSSIKSQSK